MDLAIAGRLRQPGVLAAQVRRMIADKRADALVSNFVGQWLQLRNLESKVAPDLLMFPDFDDNIRKAFRRETELLFGYILRENRSALELLSADYTFVNERLAQALRHSRRLRLAVPPGEADRSEPPRPARPRQRPVADVGGDADLAGLPRQVRADDVPQHAAAAAAAERADARGSSQGRQDGAEDGARAARAAPQPARSARPAIAIIDPPGFALENFNSVGQWREKTENGAPIDTGGVLADGTKVDGPVALRNAILSRPDAFATVLTERMMTYALGRGVEPSDMPVVRSIVKNGGSEQLSAGVNRSEHRRERAVPDADPAGAGRRPLTESLTARTQQP